MHRVAYAQFGAWIRSCYGAPVAQGALPAGATSFVLTFAGPLTVDRVAMEEDQSLGQLIVSYTVEAQVGGVWQPFSSGVTVGSKRIDIAAAAVSTTALRFSVTEGFGVPTALKLSAFAPGPCAQEPFEYPLI